jgi:hypothetical protein
MHTYRSALALAGVSVPGHLMADAEVPVLTQAQAQGDLLILPGPADGLPSWTTVPDDGVQLIRGEASGNTHWLHRGFDSPGVRWAPPARQNAAGTVVAHVHVPADESALLLHTDEHGANAMGPGDYTLLRKRERTEMGVRYVRD